MLIKRDGLAASRSKKIGWSVAIFIVLFLFMLALAGYFNFFYYEKCNDEGCFKSNLVVCNKAVFTKDTDEATWFYRIEGKDGTMCNIFVELLQLKKGDVKAENVEKKSMTCYLPFTLVDSPESDLSRCHGILKEEIQAVIIQKMHSYIISNIGEIKDAFDKL